MYCNRTATPPDPPDAPETWLVFLQTFCWRLSRFPDPPDVPDTAAEGPIRTDKEEVPGSSPGRPTEETPAKGDVLPARRGRKRPPSRPLTATVLQPGRTGGLESLRGGLRGGSLEGYHSTPLADEACPRRALPRRPVATAARGAVAHESRLRCRSISTRLAAYSANCPTSRKQTD